MPQDGGSIVPMVAQDMAAKEAVLGYEPSPNLPYIVTDENVEAITKQYFPELLPLTSKLIGLSIIPHDRVRFYHFKVDSTFDLMESSKNEDYLGVSMTALIESLKFWAHLKVDNARDGKLLIQATKTTKSIEYSENTSRRGGLMGFFRR